MAESNLYIVIKSKLESNLHSIKFDLEQIFAGHSTFPNAEAMHERIDNLLENAVLTEKKLKYLNDNHRQLTQI